MTSSFQRTLLVESLPEYLKARLATYFLSIPQRLDIASESTHAGRPVSVTYDEKSLAITQDTGYILQSGEGDKDALALIQAFLAEEEEATQGNEIMAGTPKPKPSQDVLGLPPMPQLGAVIDRLDFEDMMETRPELVDAIITQVKNEATEQQVFQFIVRRYGDGRERLAYRAKTIARFILDHIEEF